MLALFRALKHFLLRPKRSSCVSAHQQHSGGLLYQPPGRSAFAPLVQAGVPNPCVVLGQTPLAESRAHSWASQYGSRHPVEAGAEARGMDASPRGGEADMESFRPGSGGPVCDSVPLGDRSANPATDGASGRRGLQRALLSVSSAQKRSGTERLAALSGVSRAARAARAAVSCRSSASKHTRGQS